MSDKQDESNNTNNEESQANKSAEELKNFYNTWQDKMTKLATDPSTLKEMPTALQENIKTWQKSMQGMMDSWQGGESGDNTSQQKTESTTTPVSGASQSNADDHAVILRRLDAIDAKLDRLEKLIQSSKS